MGSIDETALIADWTEQQKARLKLKQKAKQFIDSEPDLKRTTSWTTLKDALKQQFTLPYVRGAAKKNFVECRQRVSEPSRQFLTSLKILGNKTITLTGVKNTDQPILDKLEQDITTQFILGLLMPIKQRVLSRNPATLAKALELAERVENVLRPSNRECRNVNTSDNTTGFRNQQNRNTGNQRNMNTQGYRGNNTNGQYEREYNMGQGHRNQSCTRCKRTGHTAEFCSGPVSKCYGCNQPGHVIRFCPDRSSNNAARQLCFFCQKPGHFSRFCPERSVNQRRPNDDLIFKAASLQPRGVAANQAGWE